MEPREIRAIRGALSRAAFACRLSVTTLSVLIAAFFRLGDAQASLARSAEGLRASHRRITAG